MVIPLGKLRHSESLRPIGRLAILFRPIVIALGCAGCKNTISIRWKTLKRSSINFRAAQNFFLPFLRRTPLSNGRALQELHTFVSSHGMLVAAEKQ
jgi:hypothetical protein